MTTPLWAFLQPKDTEREGEKERKSLECFVSRNYSPIIWSKYGITGHFVVQAAWLWSSCGEMCFALEAPLWCMLPVTARITVRSAEQRPLPPSPMGSNSSPASIPEVHSPFPQGRKRRAAAWFTERERWVTHTWSNRSSADKSSSKTNSQISLIMGVNSAFYCRSSLSATCCNTSRRQKETFQLRMKSIFDDNDDCVDVESISATLLCFWRRQRSKSSWGTFKQSIFSEQCEVQDMLNMISSLWAMSWLKWTLRFTSEVWSWWTIHHFSTPPR